MRTKCVLIFTTFAFVALFFLLAPRIAQDESYHAFADSRTIWGVPNFWNVISNVPFLIVGILGLLKLHGATARVLFTGVLLTCFGSAYYHLAPNDARLVWDRAPMTIVFMAFLYWIALEHHFPEIPALCLLVTCGIASVWWWRITGDLRFYALVQFGPAVILLPKLWTAKNRKYLWAVVGFYVLAKFAEHFDQSAYSYLPISGHAWKHCFAAASTYSILLWKTASHSKTFANYFPCKSRKYLARLSIRTRPKSRSESTWEKIGPHTGIARLPWPAANCSSPEIILEMRANGNTPPFRALMRIKSAGATFNDLAIGPPPFPSLPWQDAQYAR